MAAPDPTLADALRMIAAQARQLDALAARVKALEQRLVPVAGRRGRQKLPKEIWLAQRRELAANARRARWPGKTAKSGGKKRRRKKKP